MREFKFRAWHIESEHMIDWEHLQVLLREQRGLVIAGVPKFQYHGGAGDKDNFSNVMTYKVYRLFDYPEMVVMEWTGLKDAKDRDIYEGDVVSYQLYRGNSGLGIVEFLDGAFVVTAIETGRAYIFLGTLCADPEHVVEWRGNIFDDPMYLEIRNHYEQSKRGGK